MQLVDIGTPSAPSSAPARASDQADRSLSIEQPRVRASAEVGNDFPVLDLKFHNPGKKSELITRIRLPTAEARLDKTPSLEYSVEAVDGDLVLVVRNFGWGSAKDFRGDIDLSQFSSAIRARQLTHIEAREIPEATLTADRRFMAATFVLVRKNDVVSEQLPVHLKAPSTAAPERLNDDEFWKYQELIKINGVQHMRLTAHYAAEDGTVHTDNVEVARVQRGV
jgi:hypothetical protein